MSTAIENTLKSKVTIVIFILFLMLLFGCGFMSLMIYQGTSRNQKFFVGDTLSASSMEIKNQYDINNELLKKVNIRSYDLKHAYVEVNPYKKDPLSGIIIFQTKEEEQIRVYINNEYVTTMESSKKHIIPIYNLKDDFDNIVKVESSKESQEYTLHTDKMVEDGLYYDYLVLPNKHILKSLNEGKNNNIYNGFIETDYMGKIYNYYVLKNGYNGSITLLPNGNMVTIGDYNNKYIIYEFDPRNGDIIYQIDMYDLIKKIDNTIDDKYVTNNVNYKLVFKDDVLYVGNNEVRYSFDLTNNKLISVYSSINLFSNLVWSNYLNDSLKDIDFNNNKEKIYDEITSNVNINYLKVINNNDKEQLNETNYKKVNLEVSEEWKNTIVFTDSMFITDYDFSNKDVDLYLVNRAGKIFEFNYLNKDSINNSRSYNLKLPVGQYVLFIKVDDKLYKANNIYQF